MFKDIPSNHWASRDIADAARWGLMSGYPDGTFGPERPVTRAELAAILRRLIDATPGNRVVFEAMKSAVYIQSTFQVPSPEGAQVRRAVGSGCWVAPWLVLTNAHVVTLRQESGEPKPADEVVLWGYREAGFSPLDPMKAEPLLVAHEYDLAVLRVQPPGYTVQPQPIPLGEAVPDVGDTVWAIGNPFGFPWDVCSGTIRHPTRLINYWQRPQTVIALAVPINPGNSGGMLLDVRGQLVGVPCAGIPGVNVYTFAVPLDQVRRVLERAGI